MKGASPRKGAKTTAAKQKDLGKLGRYLSASDVKGTDRTRKAESARREASLLNTYYAERGGGRGTAKRTAMDRPLGSDVRKAVVRTYPTKPPSKPGPGINDRLAGAIDAGVRTVGAAGRAVGRALTPSSKPNSKPSTSFKSAKSYASPGGTWNVSSKGGKR